MRLLGSVTGRRHMRHRSCRFPGSRGSVRTWVGLLGLGLMVTLGTSAVAGQGPPATANAGQAPASPYTAPRTPDGQPDLQGFWSNQTYTPLERRDGVTKPFYTLEELAAIEGRAATRESGPDRARHDSGRALRLHAVWARSEPVRACGESAHLLDCGPTGWAVTGGEHRGPTTGRRGRRGAGAPGGPVGLRPVQPAR